MTNKIYPKPQKTITEKALNAYNESLLRKYNLDSSFNLIYGDINNLIDCYKLTPREIEVILNMAITYIRKHKNYNRNDNTSELVALIHLGTKKEQILKTRETECLLNQWVEFGKKPIYETKIYSDEKPSFASRSDLLDDLTKWWINAVDNNHFKPKFK